MRASFGFTVTRRFAVLVIVSLVLKVVLSLYTPLSFIFVNLVHLGAIAQAGLVRGELQYVSVYTAPGVFLSPFYGLWAVLPVTHRPDTEILGQFYFDQTPEGYLLVLIMKLPVLIFDFLTALLLGRILLALTKSEKNASRGFGLWFFNPVLALMIEAWGTLDVVPAFLTLLSLHLFYARKAVLSSVVFAFNTLLRIFPILLLPLFLSDRGMRDGRIRKFFLAPMLLVFLAGAVVGYLIIGGNLQALSMVPVERFYVLRFVGFPISNGLTGNDRPIGLMFFLLPVQLFLIRRYWSTASSLTTGGLAFLLLLLAAAFHEPYHFLWVMPLITLDAVLHPRRRLHVLAITLAWFAWTVFYADLSSSGNAFFFVPPLNPFLLDGAKWLYSLGSVFGILNVPVAGVFYALKATYLIRVNLGEIALGSRFSIQTPIQGAKAQPF